MSTNQSEKARRFRALHDANKVFVMPNPWDAGSARILAGLGFPALATSSSACAGTLGRRDGRVKHRSWVGHWHSARIRYRTCLVVEQRLEIRNFDLGILACAGSGWSALGWCVLFSHSDDRECLHLRVPCKSHWSKIRVPSKSKRKRSSSSPAWAIARASFRRFSA